VDEFVAWVFGGGKVTVPKRVRELLGVADRDCMHANTSAN